MVSEQVSSTILELLNARAANVSICPSEVARALWPDNWREHMPAVRSAALELAQHGTIEIRQHGAAIDLAGELRGPIRLALK